MRFDAVLAGLSEVSLSVDFDGVVSREELVPWLESMARQELLAPRRLARERHGTLDWSWHHDVEAPWPGNYATLSLVRLPTGAVHARLAVMHHSPALPCACRALAALLELLPKKFAKAELWLNGDGVYASTHADLSRARTLELLGDVDVVMDPAFDAPWDRRVARFEIVPREPSSLFLRRLP